MRRLLLLLLFLILPTLLQARGIEPQLVAEGPAPPGGEVELAIDMRPQPGWHGYWLNPGDAGLPMKIDWQLPRGFRAGPLAYPVPSPLTIGGIMNYVFDHEYAVLVRLKVPSGVSGTVPIRADAHWLACTDKICVPEEGQLALDLPVGTGSPRRAQFDEWRKELAQPIGTAASFSAAGDRVRVAIPLPRSVEVRHPYVFAITDDIVDYEAPQSFLRSGDWLIADLRIKKVPAQFSAVLSINKGRGLEFAAVPGPVPEGGSPLKEFGWDVISFAVLGAILGGILLNLMPCVFPILALKALHVSKAGGERGEVRADALLYAAGAIVGTGALGAVLLALRAAGAEAGWAFQLQDPRTTMLLFLLGVAITANLLGFYQLPVVAAQARPAGSFATGALAAFVATPCAGPFLGAALGTALLLPPLGSIAIFAALGLGLALPFVLLAFIPLLRARLPRPGPWMDRLRRFLAIPMGASTIAALWLLFRQGGRVELLLALAASVLMLVLLWTAGRRQRAGRRAFWAPTGAAVLAAAAVLIVPRLVPSAVHAEVTSDRWSQARVAAALQNGRPVFVYFTADWCLTCKVNEAAAIERSETRQAFKKAGVLVLVGDWTNGDPAITRFLESRGRAGVPYYLWYASSQPEELPQLLTPAMLISRAEQAKR